MPARDRLRRAGFTLIEVLAALAVMGFVLLVLSQGVQFGLRAWRQQAGVDARQSSLEAVDRALRALVVRVVADGVVTDGAAIEGGPARLAIVTNLPPGPGVLADPAAAAGLEVDGRGRLVLRWVPHPHAKWIGQPVRARETVLLEGVEALELSYWKSEPGGGGTWLRAWSEPEPPALVRIRLVFPPDDPRRWPDIVAAPGVR